MSLGTRLKQARQKRKLTQAELALAIGVKQQAIQRIEASKVKGTSYIVQIAKILDVTPEWLALGDEVSTESSTKTPATLPSVPLIEWSELPYLNSVLQHAKEKVPAITRVGANSFAIYVPDESMHSSDGAKVGFHRQDILIVDATRQPHDGDFVIAEQRGRLVFRQYVNDSPEAYLQALNPHYESSSCDNSTKFYGVVVNRITHFT